MPNPPLIPAGELSTELAELHLLAGELLDARQASNTRRTYKSAWRRFDAWCQARGACSLPAKPATVALYLTSRASQCASSTLTVAASAIADRHNSTGHDNPCGYPLVKGVLAGARRKYGRPPNKKRPAGLVELTRLLDVVREGLGGVRDRAVVLVGFAGALRRSELAALRVEHLEFVSEGVIVTLPGSKTDQNNTGVQLGIPRGRAAKLDPVGALVEWLTLADIEEGPVFRAVDRWGNLGEKAITRRSIALIIQALAGRAGYTAADFGGHSLRAGLATAAAAAGVETTEILSQTRHRSIMTLKGYIRYGTLFKNNPAGQLL